MIYPPDYPNLALSSSNLTVYTISLQDFANSNVDKLSYYYSTLGHKVQITQVLEFIVNALLNNFVRVQCLYGIKDSFLPIAVMTFPKYDNEELIATASVNV